MIPVTILIPTYNNISYLGPCLNSLILNRANEGLFRVVVVNNGHPNSCDWIQSPFIEVVQAGENLGWEGGLKLGLTKTDSPFVVFLNDDTRIPVSSRMWLMQLLQHFRRPKVAAVGPSTNVVMGMQNIFADITLPQIPVRFLIGFCLVVRRSALDEVGGVDDTLPGGDDLDLSIRFRKAGYKLIADRDVFIFHHGFKTGERIHGTPNQAGGWNSYEFKEKVDTALIRKHGFREWWFMMKGLYEFDIDDQSVGRDEKWEDVEGDVIRNYIVGPKILDLGCGGNKTVPEAIGLDMVQKDDFIDTLHASTKSVADVNHDVSQPLPFEPGSADTIIARHILEHMTDPLRCLIQWKETLRPEGRLIIAVPDEDQFRTIPINIEHKHAWDQPSMKNLLETIGFKVLNQIDPRNDVSFITIAQKI